ncbi:glycosyltransferase family 2 protein [Mucilaginibacter sp.]|uniref:glycosyltransferase family 2 protein n=1 Tax=Mucilaginibacter sp. TaxID=1882438 RepID=UPI003D125621
MRSLPLVSVIMPVFNCEKFIKEAIDSILNQSFVDFELIIIDDCSTDDTVTIINEYKDQRINFIQKLKNTGYVSSLNMALKIAKGELIARMDGDDVSHLKRLEKQVTFLNSNPNIAICGSWYELSSTKETIKYPTENEEIKIALLEYCALGHPTVMFRKSFLNNYQLSYDEAFSPAEDYELWTRIAVVGQISNIPETLLYYRMHTGQVSVKERSKQMANADYCRIRMLCYPLNELTSKDIETSTALVKNERIGNLKKMLEMLNWLDDLSKNNLINTFYKIDLFERFIFKKKKDIIRTFYLHTTPYNPLTLIRFATSNYKFRVHFSFNEKVKFGLKCLISLKVNN